MPRDVTVHVKVKLQIKMDEGIEVSEALDEIEYVFHSGDGFDVMDTEILDHEVVDSK